MKKKRGRPKLGKSEGRGGRFGLRLFPHEKAAFEQAAKAADLDMSTWVRLRLRRAANDDLVKAGQSAPFPVETGLEST